MKDREKKWRQKNQEKGRKQIACWIDADVHQALKALIQEQNLRGMGDAICLLVDARQTAQEATQAVHDTAPIPSIRFSKSAQPNWQYDALRTDTGEIFAHVRRAAGGDRWEAVSSRSTAILSALRPMTGKTRDAAARRVLMVDGVSS